MALIHAYSQTVADGTATSVVRPSDWNSAHVQQWAISGNTLGSSNISGTDITFQGGNGVTISADTAGSKIVWSVATNYQSQGAYLTTAMQSNAATISNINVSAGTTSNNLSALTFSNANGLAFGLNGSVITGSYTVPSTAGLLSAVNVSAGTTSNNMSALTFSNLNGVSFGLNGSVVTGSVATSYRASNDAVGLNTALTAGPLAWTVGSAGISLNASSAAGTTSGFGGGSISGSMTHNTAGLNLSLSHPAWLTTAMQSNAATISNINVSAGTTSNNLSALTFSNLNGVSFGLNGSVVTGSVATSYRASNDAIGLNTAQSNVTWTVGSAGLSLDGRGYVGTATAFSGTNVSATMTHNSAGFSLQLSGGGGGVTNQTGPNISAGSDALFTSGTVTFGNAFNGSFVTSNGSVVYSNNFLTTAAQSNHSHGNPTLALTNLSGTTASASNGFTLSLSAADPGGGGGIAIAAGGATASDSTVVFSNSNNITFGLNGSTMTASYADPYESIFWRPNDFVTTVGAPIVNSASIVYTPMDHNLSATRFDLLASVSVGTVNNNSSAGFLYTITAVLYTRNGNSLSSVSSAVGNNQMTWTSNATGSVTGAFFLSVPMNVNAPADKYWVGVQLSTRATGMTGAATTSLGNTVSMFGVGSAQAGAFSVREPGANTASSAGWFSGMGMYSGTTNYSTIGFTNLTQIGTGMQRANIALRMFA